MSMPLCQCTRTSFSNPTVSLFVMCASSVLLIGVNFSIYTFIESSTYITSKSCKSSFGAGGRSLDGSGQKGVDDAVRRDDVEMPRSPAEKSSHSPANRRKHRRLQSAADDKVDFRSLHKINEAV